MSQPGLPGGENTIARVSRPQVVDSQRVAGLPFFQPSVQVLLRALVLFCLQPARLANKDLRPLLAQLLGLAPSTLARAR
jgi:hypothetical protein